MSALVVSLGSKQDLAWAQTVVAEHHYLHRKVDWRARPMVYLVMLGEVRMGVLMVSIPHATRCSGWWGYPGLPTQWQVVDLCRIWLDPRIQAGGEWCKPELVPGFVDRWGMWRPIAATWAMGEVLTRIQRDRIALWPPVFPALPYHIRLVISYHDPRYHHGTIYRQMGWLPMYTDDQGRPVPGPSGKFGWCWQLPSPEWNWDQIEILQPRTMRLALNWGEPA